MVMDWARKIYGVKAKLKEAVSLLKKLLDRLHDELEYAEKLSIVEMLWLVAFADAELSKHEDGLVRKIGDLLYVSRSDQMRLRNEAMQRQGQVSSD